jgi:mannose-1-phosphate guanylyltransferase/mannose-1-phosphate guanylyltransferase/mannose-6-phosphate isomerase
MSLLTRREKEERPWGSFERFTHNELSTVKIISLKPEQELSLQKHATRSEFWRIIAGAGVVTINDAEQAAAAGADFEIPAETPHRIKAGPEGVTFLEIALGDFDENDEIRLRDDYGRTSPAREST